MYHSFSPYEFLITGFQNNYRSFIQKSIYAISFLLCISLSSNSQILKSKYDRNIVSFGFTFSQGAEWHKFTPDYLETAPFTGFLIEKKDIVKSLINDRIPNKIIKSLLFDSNGNINYQYIFKRGEYNAIDADIAFSKLANEGKSLIQNSGFDLLDNIHIIVYEEYEENQILFNRIKYRSYLFKIGINKNNFWSEVIDPTTNKLSVEKIDNYEFRIDLVAKKSSNKMERSFNKLGRVYKPLSVTSNIIGTNPISAKIGSKEGLRVNDLFQVLENKIDKENNIYQISKGYVRVKSIADNAGNSNGFTKSSTFYKWFSGSLDNGMILRSNPYRGLFIGASKFISSDNNSLLNGLTYQVDYLSHKYKGVYYTLGIGISDTIRSNSYILPGGIENKDLKAVISGLNIVGIIGKTIQLNFIELSPEIGVFTGSYLIEHNLYKNNIVKYGSPYYVEKDKDGVTPFSLITGFKIGLNLGKSFQIFGSVNYLIGSSSYNLTSSQKLPDTEKTSLKFIYTPTFKLGVRLIQF